MTTSFPSLSFFFRYFISVRRRQRIRPWLVFLFLLSASCLVFFGNKFAQNRLAPPKKILCWILTGPKNHKTRAAAVKKTWGRRCDKLIFMSSVADKKLGAVKLESVAEGREHLWEKTVGALEFIHLNFLDKFDFFLKADDDTYVIVKNLRLFLKNVSAEDPVYFGRKFRPHVKQGYMSGGAGYVLTRAALRRFAAARAVGNCSSAQQFEDVGVGRCLEAAGVKAGDSRDEKGRERFMAGSFHLLTTKILPWLKKYDFYGVRYGPDCCSDTAISFHYVNPDVMIGLDYLLYRLRSHGSK